VGKKEKKKREGAKANKQTKTGSRMMILKIFWYLQAKDVAKMHSPGIHVHNVLDVIVCKSCNYKKKIPTFQDLFQLPIIKPMHFISLYPISRFNEIEATCNASIRDYTF
jgi:hypothetical protein